MEQAKSCKRHCNSKFVTSINNSLIILRTTCLCNVFDTTAVCTFYVITKWNECIGS